MRIRLRRSAWEITTHSKQASDDWCSSKFPPLFAVEMKKLFINATIYSQDLALITSSNNSSKALVVMVLQVATVVLTVQSFWTTGKIVFIINFSLSNNKISIYQVQKENENFVFWFIFELTCDWDFPFLNLCKLKYNWLNNWFKWACRLQYNWWR